MSIWKDKSEVPEVKDVPIIIKHSSYYTIAYFWEKIPLECVVPQIRACKKWCYLDDLLELSNKVERLGKAIIDCYQIIKKTESRDLENKSPENEPMYHYGQIAAIIKSEMENNNAE